MNIVFFGSSLYCLPILEIINKNFQLSAVVTKENSASKSYALSRNITHFTPKDKSELSDLKGELISLRPDLAIVADYGLMIPKEIFDIPVHKTLNIHFSRLPKLRGPSPVQYTILFGEKSACISIIILGKEIDTGDIVWQKEIPLESGKSTNYPILKLSNNPIFETTGSLYKKLFDIAASELPDVINKYVRNELKPQKQNHAKASYTRHFTRQDGYIPWLLLEMAIKGISPQDNQFDSWEISKILPAQFCTLHFALCIERALRALSPWPGMWTEIQCKNGKMEECKKRLKILKAHLEPIASQGQPLRGYRLVLEQVQLEGKKPVSWKQFLEGYFSFSF